MDLPTTIVILLVAAGLVGWLAGARDGGVLEAFGLGFIGYRSYGWPRGVQEEDEVHFSFVARREGASDDDAPGAIPGPELIELDQPPEDVAISRPRSMR